MKIQISLSAEEYAKGDRIAFKAKKDEWYAGTVSSVRAGLVGILFDDGVKASPSKPSSRTWRRLKGTRKYVKPLTDAQVEAITVVESKTKTKAEPKAKPAAKVAAPKAKAEPKAKPAAKVEKEPTFEERMAAMRARNWMYYQSLEPMSSVDPKGISEKQYNETDFLGRWFNTGRVGATSQAAIVGFCKDEKGRQCALALTHHKTNPWLYWPLRVSDNEGIIRMFATRQLGKKMSYSEFVAARKQLRDHGGARREKIADNKAKSQEAYNKFQPSYSDINKKEVLVKWDRGMPSWHILRDIKGDKSAIKGSRTKLRWLEMRYILNMRDATTYSTSSSQSLADKLNKAGVAPDVVQGLLVAQENIAKYGDQAAKVYAKALETAFDRYEVEGVKTQVMYMLLGAAKWQGDEAKAVKKILKKWAVSKK